ncbi:hypothetical protein SARC_13011 [Sphaeroforma arctica JP610]|uniref:beta-N-acetylhexosaminidase n=1 Tax=Sphaeroforma arctica JP610 TaxID=667725 RepID=A0A0L0FD82_9EUKA|nr:hypothetical protein, variant [Sphaeroforma arctica JP610]XP_014148343.1 hypothetical protein SARC_13011 [Sphaeroforma arctica JP610]KNC74440.1 hypothetical protein, variant [Sphaeroforma arctica JP610]KNC74441.1 hypothetical protein SARC_13011 [Sphaeroforma arctica JP610]|eukprot:XP_014148342.1 hypothetical protein, variant [Sphaeroforma arctica JP610]
MAYRDRRTHRAARADLNVINCHRRYTYLDYSQSEFRLREPKAQAYLPLERAYRYSPIPYDLDPQYHHKVLGGQAQLFTEYITSWAHLMYMAYPRTCAIADRLWNTNGTTDYDEFKERLAIHLDRLKALGVNYRQPDEIQTTA